MIDIQAYVDNLGSYCPKCESSQIEGQSVSTGGGAATQDMGCLKCGYDWTDYYKLVNVIGDEGGLML